MATPVIGLDYGTSTIQLMYRGADGVALDLTRPDCGGIPTMYFFTDADGRQSEKCGYEAVTTAAFPVGNRVPCGKFQLHEAVELDGHTVSHSEILRKMIAYSVSAANKMLRQKCLPPCTDIAVTYPTLFRQDEINRFVSLCESAVTDDGSPVKVVASLPEPAAAALAFLESEHSENSTTVLTLDVGAGTTDVSLLSAYPKGKRRSDGSRYYYEMHAVSDGIKVGGNCFDDAMHDLIVAALPDAPSPIQDLVIRSSSEDSKKELSEETVTRPYVPDKSGGVIDVQITREQLERATAGLVGEIVALVESVMAMDETGRHRPDMFLLTGGSAHMPMIARAVAEKFPDYADKLRVFSPLKSVATGAGVYAQKGSQICRRTARSIALLCHTDSGDRNAEVIGIGEEIPCRSHAIPLRITEKGHDTLFSVAEGSHDGGYREIFNVIMQTGKLPAGTEMEATFTVNGQGVLQFHADRATDNATVNAEHKLTLA